MSRVLIKVIMLLPSDPFSDKCKDFMIQELRQNPNPNMLDDSIPCLQAYQSDEVAKRTTSKRDKWEKHQKRKWAYKCRYCCMIGNHKDSKCFKEFPDLIKRQRSKCSSRSRGNLMQRERG